MLPETRAYTEGPAPRRTPGRTPRCTFGAAGSVRRRLRPTVVVLGEFAAAVVVVEAAHEHVRELAIDRRTVVGEVAGPAVCDVRIAIDRQHLVVGFPGPRGIGVRQP